MSRSLSLVLVLGLALTGCRGDDNGDPPTPDLGPQPDGGKLDMGEGVESTIPKIKKGELSDNQNVIVKNVVVTVVDTNPPYTGDVFVQDPAGGEYSGIKIYGGQMAGGGQVSDLKVGDIVEVAGSLQHNSGPSSNPFKDKKNILTQRQIAKRRRLKKFTKRKSRK